jgi:hypothetical protein
MTRDELKSLTDKCKLYNNTAEYIQYMCAVAATEGSYSYRYNCDVTEEAATRLIKEIKESMLLKDVKIEIVIDKWSHFGFDILFDWS